MKKFSTLVKAKLLHTVCAVLILSFASEGHSEARGVLSTGPTPSTCTVACPAPQWITIGSFADTLPQLEPALCEYRIHNTNIGGGQHYLYPSAVHNSAIIQGGVTLSYSILKFTLSLQDQVYASFIDTEKFKLAAANYKAQQSTLKELTFQARTGAYQSVSYNVRYADDNNLIQGSGFGIVNSNVKANLLLQEKCS